MTSSAPRTAIVLDLDGTLVDTAADLCAALNHVLAAGGCPPVAVEEMRHMVGDGSAKLIDRGLATRGAEPTQEDVAERLRAFLDYYSAHIAVHSVPFPGVRETLDALKRRGLELGVCTNKPYRMTELLLRALDLDGFFGAVLGGDSLSVHKPDPRHLLGVTRALGTDPEEAVMVGDSRTDVLCARAAHVPVIVVAYGYTRIPPGELGADLVIEDFAELPAALGRLA